jgi:hypothetical protein
MTTATHSAEHTFREHDSVRLRRDVPMSVAPKSSKINPNTKLTKGTGGAIVYLYPDGLTCEVEIIADDGHTLDVVTLPLDELELAPRELAPTQRALASGVSEARSLAEAGLDDWAAGLPEEDTSEIADPEGGVPVRWVPGQGWLAGVKQ